MGSKTVNKNTNTLLPESKQAHGWGEKDWMKNAELYYQYFNSKVVDGS